MVDFPSDPIVASHLVEARLTKEDRLMKKRLRDDDIANDPKKLKKIKLKLGQTETQDEMHNAKDEKPHKKRKKEKKSKGDKLSLKQESALASVPKSSQSDQDAQEPKPAPELGSDVKAELAIKTEKMEKKRAREGERRLKREKKRAKEAKKKTKEKKDKEKSLKNKIEVTSDYSEGLPSGEERGENKRKKKKKKSREYETGDLVKIDPRNADQYPSLSRVPASDGPHGTDSEPIDVDRIAVEPAIEGPVTPETSDFPFFTRTVSLYLPLFPVGFDKPVTNAVKQHIEPLLNQYSPLLGGVLLAYRNAHITDRPVYHHPKTVDPDATPTVLSAINEYAVGFGHLNIEVDLFVPRRGSQMEGKLRLQNEGHIGVVCWDKFNASIEVNRLPRGWQWVDLTQDHQHSHAPANPTVASSDPFADSSDGEGAFTDQDQNGLTQMHTTGYWVDDAGKPVGGTLRFRIKNFDVGLMGDCGYLSIEGTILEADEERKLVLEERERERRRRQGRDSDRTLRPHIRRLPQFSMTLFGAQGDKEVEDENDLGRAGRKRGAGSRTEGERENQIIRFD